jgi:hypothetical protein
MLHAMFKFLIGMVTSEDSITSHYDKEITKENMFEAT